VTGFVGNKKDNNQIFPKEAVLYRVIVLFANCCCYFLSSVLY